VVQDHEGPSFIVCLDKNTGKDRFYVVGKKGKTLVFSHGPVCMVLAENQLDEVFTATPALVGNEIILRGEKTLYCIAAD
jgi:hypothetical protein